MRGKKGLPACFLILFLAVSSTAMDGAGGPPAGIYPGTMVRHGSAQGYSLMYQLLDMKERGLLMQGMEGMEMPGMSKSPDITNHFMVFIGGSGGSLTSGTVGFVVTGPDGREQKTMTMGMQGGYGADVSLKARGTYRIVMKAIVGDKTLLDEFTYQVK